MESVASSYMPKVEEMVRVRRAELEEMKTNVRANPDQVEAWFDKQIEKLDNMDVKEMLKNAIAGIWSRIENDT